MIMDLSIPVLEGYLSRAQCPEDIFGALPAASREQRAALHQRYGALSRACHPDLAPASDRELAASVFMQLTEWKRWADEKVAAGTYGDRSATRQAPFRPLSLSIRGKTLTLESRLTEGTFATLYTATWEDHPGGTVAKIARDPADNDLIARESAALRRMHETDARPEVERFLETQRAYVPHLLDTFLLEDTGAGPARRANVLWTPDARRFTAQELRTQKFPGGIEPRHAYWVFRRLLLTLWMAHLKGLGHGAVTPDHVLVYPEEHGIVLLDWTCSAELGVEHIPALNDEFRDFYPPEVLRREPVTPATDIYMAAAVALYLLGAAPGAHTLPATVPVPVGYWLLRCLNPNPGCRPQDAEHAHDEFGRLIESVHGPRSYAEFVVP